LLSSYVSSIFSSDLGTEKSSKGGYIFYELEIEKCIQERFQALMSF